MPAVQLSDDDGLRVWRLARFGVVHGLGGVAWVQKRVRVAHQVGQQRGHDMGRRMAPGAGKRAVSCVSGLFRAAIYDGCRPKHDDWMVFAWVMDGNIL